jgi:fatty-acid desaturase
MYELADLPRPFDPKKHTFLTEPTYGWTRDGVSPYKPTLREVLREQLDTLDFVRRPHRGLNAALFAMHIASAACFVAFLVKGLTLASFVYYLVAVQFFCHGPHTLWYHRYCGHRAFKFKHRAYALLFCWFNPLYFPEEHYAIGHPQHHRFHDHIGDPHGPHLGYWGNYFSIDTMRKTNTDISPERYEKLKKAIEHIGHPMASYDSFRKTGQVEMRLHYVARLIFANCFWSGVAYLLGGVPFILAWYAASFTLWALFRNFSYWGHLKEKKIGVANWEFHTESGARNQAFYAWIASEWHDNHHSYPTSSNLGFLPRQVDFSFQIIRFLKWLGVVESYIDGKEQFLARFGSQALAIRQSATRRAELA